MQNIISFHSFIYSCIHFIHAELYVQLLYIRFSFRSALQSPLEKISRLLPIPGLDAGLFIGLLGNLLMRRFPYS